MASDHTQLQSVGEQRQAKDLSLQSTRPPAPIDGFDPQRRLGHGAFGEVWLGTDRNTGRQVAVKFYTRGTQLDWTHLTREVEKLVFLSADRYVVQLQVVGWDADPPYFIMEYVENGSLEDLLQRCGALGVSEAVELFREIAVGLVHAHGKGVLHCDLKPANILLDQDHKPRLADFGQSRLSNEQSPALGTLFYMAPEQADLAAVPDARWDVYALGAILYCMLTGHPPYRDAAALEQLDSAKDLHERLDHYRQWIKAAPAPSGHRRRGVDRGLVEIIDRCLAVNPERRFPNVQAVLDALQARDESRVRNPLVFLGFIGPVLLLLIMGYFGLRGYDQAVSESETMVGYRARESNSFAAKFAASSIQGEIARYFEVAEREAASETLRELFSACAATDVVDQLRERNRAGQSIEDARRQFMQLPVRLQLNGYLETRLNHFLDILQTDASELKLASMFTVNRDGRMLAVAYDHDEPSQSIGFNYAYRTYFHGGPADLARYGKHDAPSDIVPIRSSHFSAAFPSTTTGLWKVAVSTPIFDDDGEVAGVLALTVNLGDFAYFRSNQSQERFAALIDGRAGPNRGVILQHPLFDDLGRDGRGPSKEFHTKKLRVTDDQLVQLRSDYHYHDPLARSPEGAAYRGTWIAAAEEVPLPGTRGRERLIVIVQERYDEATQPVQNLGQRLKREGIWALGGVLAVIVVLWYIVLRMLSEPRFLIQRGRAAAPATTRLPDGTAR